MHVRAKPRARKTRREKADPKDKFSVMDHLGRGHGQAEFWQQVSYEDRIDYLRWLIKERRITIRTELTRMVPTRLKSFLTKNPSILDDLGLTDARARSAGKTFRCPPRKYIHANSSD